MKMLFPIIIIVFIALIGVVYAFNFEDEVYGFTSTAVSSVGTFLGLTDTPSSYSGEGSNCVKVNAGETALEFGACGAAGGADGNASSICAGTTTYLDGEGNCDDISSVYWAFSDGSYNATYDAYSTNVSINYTLETYNAYNDDWISTYNATYDAYSTNVSFGDSFVNESGDNMTGNLNMNYPNNITFAGNITIWYNGSDLIIE